MSLARQILFGFSFFLLTGAAFSQNFLLSIPRSGAHFFLYGLGYLILEPFSDLESLEVGRGFDVTSPFYNPFKVDINSKLPPIVLRTHEAQAIQRVCLMEDKLIFILRNPLEVIVAKNKFRRVIRSTAVERITQWDMDFFLSYVEFFDSWDEDKRLLIYYEDLISRPEKVFQEALHFLNRKEDLLDRFIEQISFYKEISRQVYSERFPSHPAVSQALLHWREFDLENIQQAKEKCKQYFLTQAPSLYNRYLASYF